VSLTALGSGAAAGRDGVPEFAGSGLPDGAAAGCRTAAPAGEEDFSGFT